MSNLDNYKKLAKVNFMCGLFIGLSIGVGLTVIMYVIAIFF